MESVPWSELVNKQAVINNYCGKLQNRILLLVFPIVNERICSKRIESLGTRPQKRLSDLCQGDATDGRSTHPGGGAVLSDSMRTAQAASRRTLGNESCRQGRIVANLC
jgi:hypothetical protein